MGKVLIYSSFHYAKNYLLLNNSKWLMWITITNIGVWLISLTWTIFEVFLFMWLTYSISVFVVGVINTREKIPVYGWWYLHYARRKNSIIIDLINMNYNFGLQLICLRLTMLSHLVALWCLVDVIKMNYSCGIGLIWSNSTIVLVYGLFNRIEL